MFEVMSTSRSDGDYSIRVMNSSSHACSLLLGLHIDTSRSRICSKAASSVNLALGHDIRPDCY